MASKTTAAKIAEGIYRTNLRKLCEAGDALDKWARLTRFMGHHAGMTFPEAVRVFMDRAEMDEGLCQGIAFKSIEEWNDLGYMVRKGSHGVTAPDLRGGRGSVRLFGSDQVVSSEGELYEDASRARDVGLALGIVMADAQGGPPQGSCAALECALPFVERACGAGFDVLRRRRSGRGPYKTEAETVARGAVAALLSRAGMEASGFEPGNSEAEVLSDAAALDAVGRSMSLAIERAALEQEAVATEIYGSYGTAALSCAAMLARFDKTTCLRDSATGCIAVFTEESRSGSSEFYVFDESGKFRACIGVEHDGRGDRADLLRSVGFGASGVYTIAKSEALGAIDAAMLREGGALSYVDLLEFSREAGTACVRERIRSADARTLLREQSAKYAEGADPEFREQMARARRSFEESLRRAAPEARREEGLAGAISAAEELAGEMLRIPDETREKARTEAARQTPQTDEAKARRVVAATAARHSLPPQVRKR